MLARRDFLRTGALAAGGLLVAPATLAAPPAPADLYGLSEQLSRQWAAGLLACQVRDPARPADYGGLRGPGDAAVPGRCAEAVYPLLQLAARTGQSRYLDAARLLYDWAERRVSQPDGSWLNEPQAGSWKGTTVFMATALAEALRHYGHLLDATWRGALTDRLRRAGEFVYQTFTLDYGNINYPVAASYGLSLLGEVLDEPRFRARGRALAHAALGRFTPGGLLYGEGQPHTQPSPRGCYSIDLGYNVEESLPALVLYGQLTHDEEVLAVAARALAAHLEFMLPDGGWDNSWGTRSYKWTYWGSRTSDGCQPAYALLAGRDPRFYAAALRNAELLRCCTTAAGLLAGGPHAAGAGRPVSVHHTFCHLKALATVLDHPRLPRPAPEPLPRELAAGTRYWPEVQAWLLARGPYRATVTAYDREYQSYHQGHPAGGALSLLWHAQVGPLLAASMTEYQLMEPGNMVALPTPPLCLTPRAELLLAGIRYTTLNDLQATVTAGPAPDSLTAQTHLVDAAGQHPPGGPVSCRSTYTLAATGATLDFAVAAGPHAALVRVWLPLLAASAEPARLSSPQCLVVARAGGQVQVTASQSFEPLDPTSRAYNPVPGFEALPLCVASPAVRFEVVVG